MADKNYKLSFNMTDGTTQEVQFSVPSGETPKKGVDYFTKEDKEEFLNDVEAVRYVEQTLTEEQQAQARENIGVLEPLIGSTDDIIPAQVSEALREGRNITVSYTDPIFGIIYFTSFTEVPALNAIVSSGVQEYNGDNGISVIRFSLVGVANGETWNLTYGALANYDDIPTKTSDLTNDSGFITTVTADNSLNENSENPVQNKVVTSHIKTLSNQTENLQYGLASSSSNALKWDGNLENRQYIIVSNEDGQRIILMHMSSNIPDIIDGCKATISLKKLLTNNSPLAVISGVCTYHTGTNGFDAFILDDNSTLNLLPIDNFVIILNEDMPEMSLSKGIYFAVVQSYIDEKWINDCYPISFNLDGVSFAEDISETVNAALAQAKESGEFDGETGPAGRGIVSTKRTSGDGSPGTTDTYTITYTDDTTDTFSVYNGADGVSIEENLVEKEFNTELAITGFVRANGTLSPAASGLRTDYIPMNGITKIFGNAGFYASCATIAFYDENKTPLSDINVLGTAFITATGATYGEGYFELDVTEEQYSNVAYFIVSTYRNATNNYNYTQTFEDDYCKYVKLVKGETLHYRISENTIAFFGDSITSGAGEGDYPSLIASITGASVTNNGTSGATLATGTSSTYHIVDLINAYTGTDDIICVSGGINDFNKSVPIGSLTSGYADELDTTTVIGALESIFRKLLTNHTEAKIYYVITHKAASAEINANSLGLTFTDYHDAIVSVLEKYSIPFYDAFASSGFVTSTYGAWGETIRNLYTVNGDGIHPNANGYLKYYVYQIISMMEHGYSSCGGEDGKSGVYILSDGETINDVPDDINVVIDPNGDENCATGAGAPIYSMDSNNPVLNGVAITKKVPLHTYGFIRADGTISTVENAMRTDYVAITSRMSSIYAKVNMSSGGYALAFFDGDKNLLPDISILGNAELPQIVNVSLNESYDNAKFFVVGYYDANKEYIHYDCTINYSANASGTDDYGLNILIFGDSISTSANISVDENDCTTQYILKTNSYQNASGQSIVFNTWPNLLPNVLGCKDIRNYAYSGASYKDQERANGLEFQNLSYQIQVALNDVSNPNNVFPSVNYSPDIVIFALGTNDGSPNDTPESALSKIVLSEDGYSIDVDSTLASLDKGKFCESAMWAFLTVKKAFPMALGFCVLPIQRANSETNTQELHDYLSKMARRYGFIIIDGAYDTGIVRDLEVYHGLGTMLKDGLHPNEKGQNLLCRAILTAIRRYYLPFAGMN